MTSTQLLDLPVYYVQVRLTTTIRRSVAAFCFRRTFPALDIPGLTGASDALTICMSDLRVAFPRSLFQCSCNEDDEVELFLFTPPKLHCRRLFYTRRALQRGNAKGVFAFYV
jgi:hypothetical protein